MSMRKPIITDRTKPPLPSNIRTILTDMFSGYKEVVVKFEFQNGYSKSRVFLVRPIQEDGAELPAVVKIDRVFRIKREWLAYKARIKNRVPDIADVQGEPVYPPGSLYGGLWYSLMGAGTFDIESLYEYCQHADIEDILHVLESRLFKCLGTLWIQTRKTLSDLHLQTQYDSFLPVNLIIELVETGAQGPPYWLHPDTINERVWAKHDYVQLSGFHVVNVDYKAKRLSLDMPSDINAAYRIHVYPVLDIEKYELGEKIHRPFMGLVRKTRQTMLQEQTATAMGSTIDITATTFTLANGTTLSNPLTNLSRILDQTFDAHIAYIHGDLHLQNVLVEPENRNAYLIDFSHARRDHILRDLIHLESAVVTQLLPDFLAQTKQTPEIIVSFYERLHCVMQYSAQVDPPQGLEKPFAILESIRRAARAHLFRENNWDEYYYGLIIYLLGSLKFESLDEMSTTLYPKQLAFWGASVALKLLEKPPSCTELFTSHISDKEQQGKGEHKSNQSETITHFHGPVTGPVHTGSGNVNITGTYKSVVDQEGETKRRSQNSLPTHKLRQILTNYFNESELQNLTFDLGVDYENLAGKSEADKARELLAFLERRGRVSELVEIIIRLRPNILQE